MAKPPVFTFIPAQIILNGNGIELFMYPGSISTCYLRKDAEMCAGCDSGIIATDEYHGVIKRNSLLNTRMFKQKEISFSDEPLTKYLTCDELVYFKNGNVGDNIITESGFKQ